MTSFKLSLITPNGKIFEDSVEAVMAPGIEGFFGVLANHIPMVTLLKEGLLKITQNQNDTSFMISSGILEVNPNNDVVLLCDEASDKNSEKAFT
jgi:F-type H+-transporting ATPase subunit epsilon